MVPTDVYGAQFSGSRQREIAGLFVQSLPSPVKFPYEKVFSGAALSVQARRVILCTLAEWGRQDSTD